MRPWTQAEILDAIRRWHHEFGSPPRENEWKRAPVGYPSASVLRRAFGSWNNAVVAAGFRPRKRGGQSHPARLRGKRLVPRIRQRKRTAYLSRARIAAAYRLYSAGMSLPQIAELLWERYGYRSKASCQQALLRAFHADVLPLRTRKQAAQLVPKEARQARARKGAAARKLREAA